MREEPELLATGSVRLVICSDFLYMTVATAFRQLKRTVVVPTRMVRAWSEQPIFQC
jgi:hypothetical protein